MALRKKKVPQQDDSEKLQELLQSWNIQIPEKKEKADFPETSLNDFPKADFPQSVSLEKKLQEEIPFESDSVSPAEKSEETVPEIPEPVKPEINPEAFFGKSVNKKKHSELPLTGNADLDKLFKKQVIQYLHGTIRMTSALCFLPTIVLISWGISVMHGIGLILSVLCFFSAVLWSWYVISWKLTFNGETNRFSYTSLRHEEIQFHASEIESFKIESRPERFWMQVICLGVHGQEIRINLGYSHLSKTGVSEYVGGYHNADKLKEYLEIYQQLHGAFSYHKYLYKNNNSKSSSSKEELMNLLAQYQEQINQKNQNHEE